ncbi:hypothetical protein B0H14DRAFT_3494341 [Mycena olivaceomarginata]|nr:hypothetical protein B0H14DRAFT_3494341 [Mycena olivaceomarginata]
MEDETGERAGQVLERAYNLDPEDLYEDADNLSGWRMQDVPSTIFHRFGFEEPVALISSSHEMERKACAWAIGDDTYAAPDASALPTFLQHLLEGDLSGFQAELCDLTSPDSDLALEWNVDVEIISQRDKKLYSIRPRGSEAPGSLDFTGERLPPSFKSLDRAGGMIRASHPRTCGIGRGVVHPSWERPANHVPLAPPSINTRVAALPATNRLSLILGSTFSGGTHSSARRVVARLSSMGALSVDSLARLFPDFEDIACLDPSEDILKTGARVLSRNGEEALWA